jgi:DNA helicase-2/ATP-dependent DNA helicase PcrA
MNQPAKPISYSDAQKRIIAHRDSHLQVVACAGSGKTETVSMRVARLLAEGVAPSAIIAFTFTNAAADSLKTRIIKKVQEIQPTRSLDELSPMFVGTIHAFCLRFLQERAPRYATFDLYDDHRLVGLLTREYGEIGLGALGIVNMTEAIQQFLKTAAIVENEMIDPAALPPGAFRDAYGNYLAALKRYHVLTFNQSIARAVKELQKPHVAEGFRAGLRHLIVDEFQDINPAQARLIEILGASPVQTCVVGDDDQAIYQWRGSSVGYIQQFQKRFSAHRETLAVNRRSRETIVTAASTFAKSIPGRIAKDVSASREAHPQAVQRFVAPDAATEAAMIADAIARMHASGIAYRDMAVLVRSMKTSGEAFLQALGKREIPSQCDGRSGLFLQPEAELLGKLYAGAADLTTFWNARSRTMEPITLDVLMPEVAKVFGLPASRVASSKKAIARWQDELSERRDADLVGSFYGLLSLLGVGTWDPDDAKIAHRLGVLARFSQLLADFESVTRRARKVDDPAAGRVVRGGLAGGAQYLEKLAKYISYYAQSAYDDFGGEPDFDLDGVTISTIHGSKGLEWPVVFVPCLSKGRFPSRYAGKPQKWLLPRSLFPAERYEGSDDDERRLFYVAITRARDHVYLSTHDAVTKNRAPRSPYFVDVCGAVAASNKPLWVPSSLPARGPDSDDKPTYSFSEVMQYGSCPMQYRLRNEIGFQPPAVKELGYGKAVHHILRRVAEHVKGTAQLPTRPELNKLFEHEFYLPFADRPAWETMEAAARTVVQRYLTDFQSDLHRVWEVERSFELHLDDANVKGRADVILDREDGIPGGLALVDYKTRAVSQEDVSMDLQLKVYAAAARGEGFDVRAAYLHDLTAHKSDARVQVPTGAAEVAAATATLSKLARGIRQRAFAATPGEACGRCDVRGVCRSATT